MREILVIALLLFNLTVAFYPNIVHSDEELTNEYVLVNCDDWSAKVSETEQGVSNAIPIEIKASDLIYREQCGIRTHPAIIWIMGLFETVKGWLNG